MHYVRIVVLASLSVLFGIGCSTVKESWRATQDWYAEQQVKWREAQEEEYRRLASLPPAEVVASPNPAIAMCARQSCDLFNVAQPKMLAYVAKTETSREYTGFMNDIKYLVEEKKMSEQEACRKVADAVIAADANRPDDEKVWPKIQRGLAAAKLLGTKSERDQMLGLSRRRAEIAEAVGKICKNLRKVQKALKHEKNKTVRQAAEEEIMKRTAECAAIQGQLSESQKCISLMYDQQSRVAELENYAR